MRKARKAPHGLYGMLGILLLLLSLWYFWTIVWNISYINTAYQSIKDIGLKNHFYENHLIPLIQVLNIFLGLPMGIMGILAFLGKRWGKGIAVLGG